MAEITFDISQIPFSKKDLKKGIVLPHSLSPQLAEDIGIHIGDGAMNIFPNPHGTDYYYKCSGHPENEKEWYDNFIVPLKRNLFNLKIRAKYFSDNTYGIQFRSKAIVTFYNKVIGIPLGYKVKTVDIPLVIKNSPLEFKIACLRGIFDADFSLTFKKKYKEVHYYPVIRANFASKNLSNSIIGILSKLKFNFSSGSYSSIDKRTGKIKFSYDIFISGKNQLKRWFTIIGSNNPNNITKFQVWKKFGFCPPHTTLSQRKLILLGELDPLIFENGRGGI